jgi:dienelactone hydrolase
MNRKTNSSKPTGVIIIPMIFGVSAWHYVMARYLQALGYEAEIVDPFLNQPFKRPHFIQLLSGNEAENLKRLAGQLDDEIVESNIRVAAWRLNHKNCHRVYIFGSSLGGMYGIRFASRYPQYIKGLFAWYPTLLFPDKVLDRFGNPKHPPDPLTLSIPLHIFIGTKDTKLHANTLDLIKKLTGNNQSITASILEGAPHAFWEATIQSYFPNPFFRPHLSIKTTRQALKKMI